MNGGQQVFAIDDKDVYLNDGYIYTRESVQ